MSDASGAVNQPGGHGGRCQCGGVSFRISGPLRSVSDCHCAPCRRFTGHHMAATAANTDRVNFNQEQTLQWYAGAPGVEYGFCGRCGSSLFWRADDKPGHLSITAGCLDQPTGLKTTTALFIDEHGDYHHREPVAESFGLDRE